MYPTTNQRGRNFRGGTLELDDAKKPREKRKKKKTGERMPCCILGRFFIPRKGEGMKGESQRFR